ncbi:MAG: cache domain-containing protein [Candidatus Aureabacteria bacterium]|nr:cache domain-containing protein [Candidatus Auribacterota bacterium]
MKISSIKTKLLFNCLAVILVLGILISGQGYYVIKKDIIDRAQKQVKNDLGVARLVFYSELLYLQKTFSVIRYLTDIEELKQRLNLDYLFVVDIRNQESIKSDIAKEAISRKQGLGGARIIEADELSLISKELSERCIMPIRYTPKANPTNRKMLEQAMSLEYARPFLDPDGKPNKVMYGGIILNKDFTLVDKIRDHVFENRMYEGKPIGTVTIFLDDTRITTNVLDDNGQRAVGTRVSSNVYKKLLQEGRSWFDRAFVVTDWYLTAYEPIKNIHDKIIGALYVGTLEKPFDDLQRNIFLFFVGIILFSIFLGTILSLILDGSFSRPFRLLIEATRSVAEGNLKHRIPTRSSISELNELAESFNKMGEKLNERDLNLKETNEKLAAMNQNYLDLIGFVSHELKGILGSTVMNIYSIKEGLLGPLNDKQQKAVNATAKTLDHFETMVKNYLDLSHIEKGEMELKLKQIDLNEDIIKPAFSHFEKQIHEKGMLIENNVSPGLTLVADKNLMLIVCDNLLSNACKYSASKGTLKVEGRCDTSHVHFSLYNDGSPIREEEKGHLFKKFSRLPGTEKIKGTGIGLYITKEIIEKHNGKITVESLPRGNQFLITLPRGTIR